MPDASGTPSANYLIPKFNTAVDPPSGKGTNTIVDFVDTLLKNTFINKPAGILTGETPVWNSSSGTWVRSTATNIGPTSLGSGTPDATKLLGGDGTWQALAWQTYVPVWAEGGAPAPSIGNGTISGRYVQIGKTVFYHAAVTGGTTTVWGNAGQVWTVSLPVAASGLNNLHFALIRANHAGSAYTGTVQDASSSSVLLGHVNGAGALIGWNNTIPFAWASGDFFQVNGVYEAA